MLNGTKVPPLEATNVRVHGGVKVKLSRGRSSPAERKKTKQASSDNKNTPTVLVKRFDSLQRYASLGHVVVVGMDRKL